MSEQEEKRKPITVCGTLHPTFKITATKRGMLMQAAADEAIKDWIKKKANNDLPYLQRNWIKRLGK